MRKYSSTIPAMTLGAQLTAGATSITLSTGAWPTVASPDTLTLVIEPDTANEEIVYVTAHTSGSTSATILRAQESTTDITHANGSVVKHMITGADLQEAHTHMAANNYSSNGNVALHGIGTGEGAVVGTDKTQTLKNKTINVGGADNNTIGGLTVSNVSGIAGTYAPLASPALTGTPTAPTASSGTNTTQLATTAFVQDAVNTKVAEPASNGIVVRTGDNTSVARSIVAGSNITVTNGDGVSGNITIAATGTTAGVSSIAGTANQITASASTGAVTLSIPSNLILPSATTATTQTTGDSSTKVATTAFVQTAVAGAGGGTTVQSGYGTLTWSSGTGTLTVTTADTVSTSIVVVTGSDSNMNVAVTSLGTDTFTISAKTVDGATSSGSMTVRWMVIK